jgi:hypothetical protein
MIFIFIVALIASISMSNVARDKGYPPRPAAGYPFKVALVVLVIGLLIKYGSEYLLALLNASSNVAGFFSWALNLFVLLVYLAIISHAWKRLKALTPLGSTPTSEAP